MLPYDNKSELQVLVDLPEGTTLESTSRAVADLEGFLVAVAEVRDVGSYVGAASAIDFNGLVRHYYLRRAPHLADLRVNLAPKGRRAQQSHEIALRLRLDLEGIGARHGAKVKVVETPPGPPVLSTLVAEVTGPPSRTYAELLDGAREVERRLGAIPGIVDARRRRR